MFTHPVEKTPAEETVPEEQGHLQSEHLSARELHAEKASLFSGFNHWSESATPMTPLKDGRFKAAVDLAKDSNYQIRNLINDIEWRNDWDTDQYVPNPFSGDNSVVEV